MKAYRVLFTIILLAVWVVGCSGGSSDEGPVLATINQYKLKRNDFMRLLATDMETDETFKLTESAKKKYLNEIIQKEILIQEAKRLKLDRKAKFVRAIERYWEATLIRDLIAAKSEEISHGIVVTEAEIQKQYAQMKQENHKLPPLSEIERDIASDLKEKKKTAALQGWMEKLRQGAKISINHEMLSQL